MKFRLFSIFALAGLLLGSCAVDELPAEGGSIVAEMETDQTRTAVSDDGTFTWSEGDKVWLHTTSGSVIGTLSSGAGSSSAKFTYGGFVGEMTGKAVYPYNDGHSVSGEVLNFVLPASYDLGSSLTNTNAAMYGVNVGGTIKFNHLAGVMRFVLKNVPAGANKFTITLDKKINGTFTADLTADYPVLETAATSSSAEKTVTLNFDALSKTSDVSLYIPLPVGTYTTLALGLYDDDQAIWTYSNAVTNTISRKTLKLMPAVSMGGSIGGEIEGGDGSGGSSGTVSTDLSASGTANSYIVSEAGSYKFTPTKGNSNESVGSIASAEVLWETFGTDVTPVVGDLVKNVKYENGVISFETPSAYKEGNAVIAAKDASGTILWSWHIWLTDQPEGQVYYNNAGTVMDRNLGATSATPGAVSAMGLLYQWGRKDPFLGSSNINEHITAKSSYNWPESVMTGPDIGTVAYTIANPTTYISYDPDGSSRDWFYFTTKVDNTLWESQKTKYDPCPSGWRIPDGGETGLWSRASNSSDDQSFTYDEANKGMNFTGKFGDYSVIWYPDQSKSAFANSCGDCYWSCTPVGQSIYYLGISDYGRFFPAFSGVWRSDAHHVRCVKDGPIQAELKNEDYVDEFGINHGKGVKIGETIWAPVNCGYHKDDYKYGKLYQWGRKYGQGYEEENSSGSWFYTGDDGVTPAKGNYESNAKGFYNGSIGNLSDWANPHDDTLWNSGTEQSPSKSQYDPCPDGWRVPTYAELNDLKTNHSSLIETEDGYKGYWFTGPAEYSETAQKIFLPLAGQRYSSGSYRERNTYGYYWSSKPAESSKSYYMIFYNFSNSVKMDSREGRACGNSLRCVSEFTNDNPNHL